MATWLYALAAAAALHSGIVYHETTTWSGLLPHPARSCRVWSASASYRAECTVEPGQAQAWAIAISRDADATATLINPTNATLYRRDENPPIPSSLYFGVSTPSRVAGKVEVESHAEPSAPLLNHPTHKQVIRIRYVLRTAAAPSVTLKVDIGATLLLTVADDVAPPAKDQRIRSGIAEVDAAIANAYRDVQGFVLRDELSVSRTYEGGQPRTERMLREVDQLSREPIAPSRFDVPPGLRHQTPVVGAPGGGPGA